MKSYTNLEIENKKLLYFALFIIISIFPSFFSPCAALGVTKTVCSSGCDFTTIQGALNWASLTAGDTISVIEAKTYNEQLTLKKNGTSDSLRITLRNDSGGTVLVQNSSSPVLNINGKSYWTIMGISFSYIGSSSTGYVIYNAKGASSAYVTFSSCKITRAGSGKGGAGFEINDPDHWTITGCTITNEMASGVSDGAEFFTASNFQFVGNEIKGVTGSRPGEYLDDGIVVTGTNINIENNIIHEGRCPYSMGHPDGIVIQVDEYTHRTGNVMVHRNIVYNFAQGIYWDAIWGDFIAPCRNYNNIVYDVAGFHPELTGCNAISISGENVKSQPTYKTPIEVYNNALISNQYCVYIGKILTSGNADNRKIFKNNIFQSPMWGGAIYFRSSSYNNCHTFDYNYYSNCNAKPIAISDGNAISMATWKNTYGQEPHGGWEGNVKLNSDYTAKATSPTNNIGVDLGTYFRVDRNNVSRPQDAGWDIGAYEFESPHFH